MEAIQQGCSTFLPFCKKFGEKTIDQKMQLCKEQLAAARHLLRMETPFDPVYIEHIGCRKNATHSSLKKLSLVRRSLIQFTSPLPRHYQHSDNSVLSSLNVAGLRALRRYSWDAAVEQLKNAGEVQSGENLVIVQFELSLNSST